MDTNGKEWGAEEERENQRKRRQEIILEEWGRMGRINCKRKKERFGIDRLYLYRQENKKERITEM